MNEERLVRLAHFLIDDVPEYNFNLGTWRAGRFHEDEDLLNHKCGTTACACGWACVIPEFQEQGLRAVTGMPWFNGQGGWNAVEKFFELTYVESLTLFAGDCYHLNPTPIDVADRILLFINDPRTVLEDGKEWERENRMAAGWHGEEDENSEDS